MYDKVAGMPYEPLHGGPGLLEEFSALCLQGQVPYRDPGIPDSQHNPSDFNLLFRQQYI